MTDTGEHRTIISYRHKGTTLMNIEQVTALHVERVAASTKSHMSLLLDITILLIGAICLIQLDREL